MLVLSRKVNETVEFPELGITVEVVRVKGNTVRLGIKAPNSVRILRGEPVEIVSEFEELQPAMSFSEAAHQELEREVDPPFLAFKSRFL